LLWEFVYIARNIRISRLIKRENNRTAFF